MTALIVTLALLGLILSKLNQFRRDYLKSRLPEKIRPLAKNVPVKSEWLFGDDLNKRINTISSTNAARTASICPNCKYEKYQGSKTVSNQQHYGSKNSQTSRRGSAQGKRWPKKQNNSFHRNQTMLIVRMQNTLTLQLGILNFYENWKKIHMILSFLA